MDMKTDLVQWDVVDRDAFGRMVGMSAWCGRRPAHARPYRFLVPVDGSTASASAVHVAAQMADRVPEAELHLLNVQLCAGNDARDDAIERDGLYQTRLARAALDRMGAPYRLRIAAGSPAETIRAHARDEGIAEIVMGSHGAGRVERLLMGSVAMDVAERAGIPVTLVKANDRAGQYPAEWIDWLVPCDGSESSVRAVRYLVHHLSQQQGRPRIHLLNVQESTHPVIAAEGGYDDERPGRYRQQAARICDEALGVLKASDQTHLFHVRIGNPVAQILHAAGQFGCGHIVMGSRGLGLFGKLVLGSVSNGVAHGAGVPVTLIT